jgi:hypothetical protein
MAPVDFSPNRQLSFSNVRLAVNRPERRVLPDRLLVTAPETFDSRLAVQPEEDKARRFLS